MVMRSEFKQLLEESSQKIAEILSQESAQENKLQSPKQKQQQIQQEIKKNVIEAEQKMYDGLKACVLALNECQDLPMSYDDVVNELQKCMSKIDTPDSLSKLGALVFSDTSWKSGLGISDNCMESLYLGAKNIFDKKDYDNSEKSFFVLCSLEPKNFAYWVGLGHSAFHNKNNQQAINAYSMASALQPDDVWPHIWAANTFEEQKEFDYAKMALDEALTIEKAKTPKNNELISSLEERFQVIKSR